MFFFRILPNTYLIAVCCVCCSNDVVFNCLEEQCEQGISRVFIQEIHKSSPEVQKRVYSTLISFSFLYDNAEALSNFVTCDYLRHRLDSLSSDIDSLGVPDCPETEDNSDPPEVYFQKINRNLFVEVDTRIRDQFMNKHPGIDFSFPVIEWAANVIPELCTYTGVHSTDEVYNVIRCAIENDNSSKQLLDYFRLGYSLVLSQIKRAEQSPVPSSEYTKLISRLKCSMCYPARVSALGS